jgi:citrate lyase beta subunit
MDFKIDLPPDVFDAQFPEEPFKERMRELAILELVRVKRLHEHEAQEMLGIGRWELVERMKAAGIAPTEEVFADIRDELGRAIAARRKPVNGGGKKKR